MDLSTAVLSYVLSALTGFAACFLAVGGCLMWHRTTRSETQKLLKKSKDIKLKTLKENPESDTECVHDSKLLENLTEVHIHGKEGMDDFVMFEIQDGDNEPNTALSTFVNTSALLSDSDVQPIPASSARSLSDRRRTSVEDCIKCPKSTGTENSRTSVYFPNGTSETRPASESSVNKLLVSSSNQRGPTLSADEVQNEYLGHKGKAKGVLMSRSVPYSIENKSTSSFQVQQWKLPKPRVKLYLCYSSVMSNLSVKLLNVSHLPAKYCEHLCKVKVKCLPARTDNSLYTKPVEIKGVEATFQENFTFKNISMNDFVKCMVRVSVYVALPDEDFFIGERYIKCVNLPLTTGKSYYVVETLKEKRLLRGHSTSEKGSSREVGNVLVVLQYDSALGYITVSVQKAQNLPAGDRFRKNPKYYTVTSFFNESGVAEMQKSSVQPGNSPVWNQTSSFCVNNGTIDDCSIEITINRFYKYQKDNVIGRVTLGRRADKIEASHWSDMLRPRAMGAAKWHEFSVIR